MPTPELSMLPYISKFIDGWVTHEDRPPREELYLAIAQLLRTQSTCTRGKVGALLVRERRIIATGYNGSPPGLPHCLDVGCDIGPDGGCQRAIHAEANVLAFAARHAGG